MKFRVGLIGNRAHQNVYGPILKAREDTEIVAMAEHHPEKARTLEDLYGLPCSQDYDAVLENPDVDYVSICTDFYLKRNLIRKAIECGKHVLVDKALARTVREAREIVKAADGASVKIVLSYSARFQAARVKLAEALKDGTYGNVVAYSNTSVKLFEGDLMSYVSYPTPARVNGGGELMNLGSHPVDYLYSLFGLPKRVYCQMENAYFEEYKAFGTEDIATLFCEYEGFSATITTGRNKASESDMACSALDVTCEGNWIHLQGNTYQVNGEEIEIPAPVFSGNEGCIQHLVDCITNDLEPITGVNNGLAVAEITTAGYQSASTGEFVSLPLKDENHPMIAADEQIIDELLD